MHRTTPRVRRAFGRLPEPVQRVARRNFQLLAENPGHPSLCFKKVGAFWSARDLIWVWVGGHDEYDRLIGS